ncbi:MAG: hypothetical protein WC787_03905 [Patescibacteria group bacterium]|jgi:tryptophanyl-tRNA synthetase
MLDKIIISDIERLEEKYRQKLQQFVFEPLTSGCITETRHAHIVNEIRQLDVWALQETDRVLLSMEGSTPYTICFGFRPSRFHLGHLTLAREIAWHLTHGASVCAIVAGTEAGNRCSDQRAQEKVMEFWELVRFFAPDAVSEPIVFGDASNGALQMACDAIARSVTMHKILQLYGWSVGEPVALIQGAIVNAATYLLPNLVVPGLPWVNLTDINQVAHAELARLSAKRLGWPLPGFFLRKLLPSLRGIQERMSGKDAKSVIFLDEGEEVIRKKFKKSVSGGRTNPDDQRRLGGDPLMCSFFHSSQTLLDMDEKKRMATACMNGDVLCGECKRQSVPKLLDTQRRLRVVS